MLIGNGWDLHQHTENEILSLGGVEFNEDGFLGHSDGDILLHALCDAFLGAVGKKDIGHYFPSNENTPENISSTIILNEKFTLTNLDITIITQKFNVKDKALKIKENLSKLLMIPKEKINIKGKSADDYGIIGDQKASLAIVSLLLDNA
jgi:2-C-methyl-D-erythritol 2,4-cyclodiphosphate synthase